MRLLSLCCSAFGLLYNDEGHRQMPFNVNRNCSCDYYLINVLLQSGRSLFDRLHVYYKGKLH